MIKVVTRCSVKADKIPEFKALAARLIVVTRKEKGCLGYTLCQDVREDRVFSFIEEWRDGDALAAHMKSKHFNEIVTLLNAMQEGETVAHVYREVR
jgi:quinol monooxygenase YgiN